MKISTDQEKKWETMWKKWENPLPQDSNDDIFADMEAAVSNWKELVQKEFKGTLGAIHKEEFELFPNSYEEKLNIKAFALQSPVR